MFDTMTSTKILGAGCGALLLFLLGGWGAELIYHGSGGHGDGEEHAQGYVIEVADAGGAGEEEEPEVDFMEMMASAEQSSGEKVFNKCKACHKLGDGENGTGPHLFGVVDRPIGGVDGFGYSDVLASNGETWTIENLQAFLEDPKGWAPGTKMSFSGLSKAEDRADLIAYLQTIGG